MRILLRAAMCGLAIVCVGGAIGFWLITQSWFIAWRVTPELQRKLGGDVTIGKTEYLGDWKIAFTDVTLRARGIKGDAGQIAKIDRVTVAIDWSRPIRWGMRVASVEVDGGLLRASEDLHESGQMNFSALTPVWERRPILDAPPPPRVQLRNTAIEFGTHDSNGFYRAERLLVAGEMNPLPNSQKLYTFQLSETDEYGQGIINGITMRGELNAETNEWHSSIDGLDLDQRLWRMSPGVVRALWDRMELQGRVDKVTMTWHTDSTYQLKLDIDNVDLTLPLGTIDWARYRDGKIENVTQRPRMHFSDGVISITQNALELEELVGKLRGSDDTEEIVAVPYRINFKLSDLPSPDWSDREKWMDNVVRYAPFSLHYSTEDLRLQRMEDGQAPAVDLPHFVANVLEKFQVTDWMLTTQLDVQRGPAPRDAQGQLLQVAPRVNGTAYLHQATGRYQKFPYLLTDVDAYLQFDNDRVIVHSLTGRGSGEARLRLSGEITPPGNDAAVSLQLTGTNVPVDARLREALHGHELEAFDMMFNRPAFDSLAAAGFIPDDAAIARGRVSLERAVQQLQALQSPDRNAVEGDALRMQQLEQEIAQWTRFVEAGSFQLGGVIDLELKINRAFGNDQPTTTTGAITVQQVGLLYKDFPYPLRITGGTLDWMMDRVRIVPDAQGKGLTLATPGGGHGTVTGELVIGEVGGSQHIAPNLNIAISDDTFNDAVYAAIPLTERERHMLPEGQRWPGGVYSNVARLLKGVGLIGSAEYRGRIAQSASGTIDYEFDITLRDCEARPNDGLSNAIGVHDAIWPPGYQLHEVAGSLRITQDLITVSNITGRSDTGSLAVNGTVTQHNGDLVSAFDFDIQNLPIGPYLLNVLSESQTAQAADVWSIYQPAGAFDARVEFRVAGETPQTVAIELQPRDVSILLHNQRINLNRTDGQLRLQNGLVDFQHLTLGVSTEQGVSDGLLTLHGTCDTRPAAEKLALRGAWSNGRLESATVEHALRKVASAGLVEQYEACAPAGLFDAEFSVTASADAPAEWWVSLSPRIVNLTWNERAVKTSFEQGSLVVEPNQIVVQSLRGWHADGNFSIDGSIALKPVVDAQLQVSHVGNIRSDLMEALLPPVARSALDAIAYDDGAGSTITRATLGLTQVGEGDDDLRIVFAGPIRINRASFVGGVKFTDVDAQFDLNLAAEPGMPIVFHGSAAVDHARAMGQTISDGTAEFGLSTDGLAFQLTSFHADAGVGAITATATSELQDDGRYSAMVDMVDVPVGRFSAGDALTDAVDSAAVIKEEGGGVWGSLSLAGTHGQPESRTGRGMVRIVGGTAMNVPLLMQVVQAAQLIAPLGGDIDFGEAQFYINGNQVVFDRILFENNMKYDNVFQLIGEGTMTFDTLNLDTRFRSRGGLPIVRDIMGGLGDILYVIEVTGPLNDPKSRLVPLP